MQNDLVYGRCGLKINDTHDFRDAGSDVHPVSRLFEECAQWYGTVGTRYGRVMPMLSGISATGTQFVFIFHRQTLDAGNRDTLIRAALAEEQAKVFAFGLPMDGYDLVNDRPSSLLRLSAGSRSAFVRCQWTIRCEAEGGLRLTDAQVLTGLDPSGHPDTAYLTDDDADDEARRHWLDLRDSAQFRQRQ